MSKMILMSSEDYAKHRAAYKNILASGIMQEKIDLRSEYGVTTQGQVSVIPVRGYISQYNDFFNTICGGCSQEEIRYAIESAVNDPAISRIVLEINSPGGDATGTAELAEYIRAATQRKQITAYVSGWACSAAYWIACACSRIIAHKSAFVGCIGTMVCIEKDDGSETVFVSSATPNKNLDPASDEGKNEIMSMLNNMTSIFVNALAEFRGVDPEFVLKNFGQGATIFAESALQFQMIDGSGALETACDLVLTESEPNPSPKIAPKAQRGKRMGKMKSTLVVVDDTAEGVVIPNGTNVDELTADWLRQNAPDVVKEIETAAEDSEMGRQSELDETAAAAETPEEGDMVKAAKKQKGVTAAQIAQKILAHRTGVKAAAAAESARLLAARQKDANEIPDIQTGAGETEPSAITPEMRSKFVAQASKRSAKLVM